LIELTGAVLTAQFRKQVEHTEGITFRRIKDPEGECGTLFVLINPTWLALILGGGMISVLLCNQKRLISLEVIRVAPFEGLRIISHIAKRCMIAS
jgi:hypothetical protein